jgi:hypothetical protein
MLKRYYSKPRKNTIITKDPVNEVRLTEQGYKLRAERRKLKKIKKGMTNTI